EITTNGRVTRGLGRYFTFSEIGIHIICTAEGSTAHPYVPPVAGVSPVVGSANDPQYVSNLPVAQFLRDAGGNIVGWDSTNFVYTSGSGGTPFPSNKTLA